MSNLFSILTNFVNDCYFPHFLFYIITQATSYSSMV